MIRTKKYLLATILFVVYSFVTVQTVEAIEIDETQEAVTVAITECESVDAKTIGFVL